MFVLKGKIFRIFKIMRENVIWLVGEGLYFNYIVFFLFWFLGSEIIFWVCIDVWVN